MIGGEDGSGDWGACDPSEPRNRRTRSPASSSRGSDSNAFWWILHLICEVSFSPAASRGVDAILFTHAHADHVTGLDDVRILNRIANRPLDGLRHQADPGGD